MSLELTPTVSIPEEEIEISALRGSGPGGQHVNKVSSAVQLRFAIPRSSLPEGWKERLRALDDARITADGVVVIRARTHRSQRRNREDALQRLKTLLLSAAHEPRPRRRTRPPLADRRKRLEAKRRRARVKALRGRVEE